MLSYTCGWCSLAYAYSWNIDIVVNKCRYKIVQYTMVILWEHVPRRCRSIRLFTLFCVWFVNAYIAFVAIDQYSELLEKKSYVKTNRLFFMYTHTYIYIYLYIYNTIFINTLLLFDNVALTILKVELTLINAQWYSPKSKENNHYLNKIISTIVRLRSIQM